MKLKLFKGKTFHRMVIGGRGVNSQDLALGAQDQGPAQGAAGNVQGSRLKVQEVQDSRFKRFKAQGSRFSVQGSRPGLA